MKKTLLRSAAMLPLSLCFALLLLGSVASYAQDIQRMEPPFWYVGMKDPSLQVMFYGKDIAKSEVSLAKYSGVKLRSVEKTDNPNYLFLYLEIGPKAKPGDLKFTFKSGSSKVEKTLPLRPRNKAKGALGFTSKDVLYLIMPDRFANGNPGNDVMENYQVDRNGGGRHGGDIQGIKDHLGYLQDLGVTAIWLNPVQFNRGGASHGYSISDFYLIDPRLGSNEEYCDLVSDAHTRDIKVVMDMIFNHCGSSHWWIEDIPASDWFNQMDYARALSERMRNPSPAGQRGPGAFFGGGGRRGERVSFPATKEEYEALPADKKAQLLGTVVPREGSLVTTTHYKWALMDPHAPESEKTTLVDGWFSGGMPDLNQRNPHLAKYLIQNSIWWIEYSRIDGIRMDTYPYADYDFMVRWCKEIHDEYPDFNIVGEGWYPRNSAAGWWQANSALNDSDTYLPTVMDFDLTFTAKREWLRESNTSEGSEAGLFKVYECVSQDFLIPDPQHVLTFLDNHDIERFMDKDDPVWKLRQGLSFLLTSRGIPQIYYGTEIGLGGKDAMRADFPGGWEEDSRNAFTREGRTAKENECIEIATKLLNWRKSSKAVTEGTLVHYTPDNATKCYVYARISPDGGERVLVVLNGSDTVRLLGMDRFKEVIGDYTTGTDVLTGEAFDLTSPLLVEARGSLVLTLSK